MSYQLIKRQLIKRAKLSHLLWPYKKNGLYCFNFHRIGNANDADFDPCVYSCTAESLEQYLVFFKSNFKVINIEQLCGILDKGEPINEKLALITFDDGYRDNFDLAYPLLKKHNIPASFFITTSLIESDCVPWWDEIAWHIKQCGGQSIKLSPWDDSIIIDNPVSIHAIRAILKRIKSTPKLIEQQLQELRAISNKEVPKDLSNNLFMDWTQLKTLSQDGIDIGAHSHTHRVLSSLSEEELIFELSESKKLLENNLKKQIKSVSYPVGSQSAYNKEMFVLLKELEYQVGFSFQSLINSKLNEYRFELARMSIDREFNAYMLKEMILCSNTL